MRIYFTLNYIQDLYKSMGTTIICNTYTINKWILCEYCNIKCIINTTILYIAH